MQPITGVVQHYPWGDPRFIPELFGRRPDGTPWAELWLGTHPKGMSRLADGRDLTAATGTLPYLLKVLAAGEPLSLQTHPSAEQAQAGYQTRRFPGPVPQARVAVCAHGVRGLLRSATCRRDDRLARGADLAALRRGVRGLRRGVHDRRPAASQGRRRHRSSRRARRVTVPKRAGRFSWPSVIPAIPAWP